MKYITLTASEMVDGNKVELGRQENFPVAETIKDVEDMENEGNGWNTDEIVACFNYGSKVKRQAQLRTATDPKAPSTVFKKAGREKQDAILALAREKGLL
jgi:hypothetical protein